MTRSVSQSVASAQPVVLFLCVHNAGRSQMAAAWMKAHAGDLNAVRAIRDDIERRVRVLLATLDVAPQG